MTKPSLKRSSRYWRRPAHQPGARAPASGRQCSHATVSEGYSSLEFDLATGKRGSRLIHAESLLRLLTGAEAAVVVNNCASAVLLVLSALAKGKRVVIARSVLVKSAAASACRM